MNRKEEKHQYYLENSVKIKISKQKYYEKHKNEFRVKARIYRLEHPEKHNLYCRKSRALFRKKIVELLGNKCNNINCPIPKEKLDMDALQIDHVKGQGTKEIHSFKNYSAYLKYVYEEISKGSKDYQLLCAYCNWLKRKKDLEII